MSRDKPLRIDWRLVSMFAVLLTIWVVFDVASAVVDERPFYAGFVHDPGNLRDLFHQVAVVVVLSIGMTLVIVSGNIDLSVGSGLGMFAAVFAALVTRAFGGDPTMAVAAVVVVIVFGAGIGLLHGALVAYLAVPSFIVTLGGLTAYLGVKLYVTKEAIPVDVPWIATIGMQGLRPGIAWCLAALAAAAFIGAQVLRRRSRRRHAAASEPTWVMCLKTAAVLGLLAGFVGVMNITYQVLPDGRTSGGLSYAVLIAACLAVVVGFIAARTRFGRHVYAIGGNSEAARYSGIQIKRHLLGVFMIMGILTAIAGMLQVGDLKSASSDLGDLKELDAIAACVIGGTSLMGGRGSILGAVLGALIMHSIRNGMRLCSIDTEIQKIILGAVLVLAVAFDQWTQQRARQAS